MKPFVRPFAAPRPQGTLVSPAVAAHASVAASSPPPASASAATTDASPSLPPAPAKESTQSQPPQIYRPAASLSAVRRPLHPLLPIAAASAAVVKQKEELVERYFTVLITDNSNSKKKHKKVDDGILCIKGLRGTLKSLEGKDIYSRLFPPNSRFVIGAEFEMARNLVELVSEFPADDFTSGCIFVQSGNVAPAKPAFQAKAFPAKRKRGQNAVDDDDDDDNASGAGSLHQSALKLDTSKVSKPFKAHAASASAQSSLSLHSSSAAASSSSSSLDSLVSSRFEPTAISKALHDPFAAGALILNARAAALRVNTSAMSDSTDSAASAAYSSDGSTGKAQVPIVVDPYVCKHLRPHQRSGVQFIYDCITGQRGDNASGEESSSSGGGGVRQFGCILADEMGLGKSLMTIALLWTLLRQGPNGPAHPLIRRALVVVPATLVDNWSREFQKWLGRERLGVVALSSGAKADEQAGMVRDFCVKSSTGAIASPVLVLSYESLRKHCEALRGCAEIGLIVCDEGHRLKNAGSKTVELLNSMPTKRRVLLTGTPVQNNLEELFGMCSVVCPGALGSSSTFRHTFSVPIEKGRDRSASAADRALGDARAAALASACAAFVLRRTRAVNRRHLPPRIEQVVFCSLSPLQIALYRRVAQSKQATAALRSVSTSSTSSSSSGGGGAFALQVMTSLRKICSHPALLWAEARDGAPDADSRFSGMYALYPHGYASSMEKLALSASADDDDHDADAPSTASASIATGDGAPPSFSIADLSIGDSGKLRALEELLSSIRAAAPGDRCVIVSTHTTTLDLIERLCSARGYSSLRLDGRVRPALRQSLVNRFNATWSEDFVFLLSAKAGGVGLNLIGANRCILFDPDWNPSTDEQCMARCWREGQRKTVYIYRLLSRGTVEEVIFQRQIKKNEFQISESSGEAEHATSSSSSNAASSVRHFSADDLRECFTLHHSVAHCRTFDLMLDVQRMQQQHQQQTQNMAKFLGAASSGSGSGLIASTASANRQLRDGPFALSEWSFCSRHEDIEDEALRAAVQALRLAPSSSDSSSSSSSSSSVANTSAARHKSLTMVDATDAEARDGVTCIATRQVVQAVATAASAASTASAGAACDALALAGDDDDEVLVEDASSEWERYCAVALDDEPSGHDVDDEEEAVLQSMSSSSATRLSSMPTTAAPSLSTTLAALDEAALLDDDECQL